MKRATPFLFMALLALLAGCDRVSKADISTGIKMCEGHSGLGDIIPRSKDTMDVYCNSGTTFAGVEMQHDAPDCQIIMNKRYCN